MPACVGVSLPAHLAPGDLANLVLDSAASLCALGHGALMGADQEGGCGRSGR
jgi:hypothetical protein